MDENGIKTDSESFPGNGRDFKPVSIPDHELLRCIGHGSYGEVWLARNVMMGTYRAVKVVHRKTFRDQRPFDREVSGIRKFEPLSRSHEGFIDVLHAGINEEEGYFYYVMELGDDQISGQEIDPSHYAAKTLATEITKCGGRLSLEDCLQFGLALSRALAELHKHGLVHRDIKPSNIIFAHGIPKLADIGLVADVKDARSYVGTEGFIPPEGPGTAQADIYSLGKVLYEASTGKDRQDFPALPTILDRLPDHERFLEFNEVILRACNNEVGGRYPSANELYGDLLVLQNGKSVKRLRMLERRFSQLKRTAAISVLVMCAAALLGYPIYLKRRAAIEDRDRKVGASIANGNHAMNSGDLMGALPYFAEAFRLDKPDWGREADHRLRFGSVLTQCPKLTHLWFGGDRINNAEFSPLGDKVLVTEFLGKVKIYDLQTGELNLPEFGQKTRLMSAAFDPEGRFVVSASQDGTACVWDPVDGREIHRFRHPGKVFNARWSPDGLRVVTSCKDGLARVWDARTGRLESELKQHTNAVLFAEFSHDGRLIVTTSYDNTARIWDARTSLCIGAPMEHENWVTYAAFSPDDKKLVTASLDRKVRMWDVATGKQIPPDLEHQDGVKSVQFSPDGQLIASASWDGTVRLWHADDLRPLASNFILRHHDRVLHASFCPDGRRIITSCSDGTVCIWDLAGAALPPIPKSGSVNLDGSRFVAITNDVAVVYDDQSEKLLSGMAASPQVEKIELTANGHFILTRSFTKTDSNQTTRLLQVWETATGKKVGGTVAISNSLAGMTLSEDGRYIAVFGGKKTELWSINENSAMAHLLLHDETVNSVRFSMDGHRLATTTGGKLYVWNVETGLRSAGPMKHPQSVQYMSFSPDGSRLVACCSDAQLTKCAAYIWDSTTGQLIGNKLKHGDGVLFASFSPDGQKIVTASEDYTAAIWNAATGQRTLPPLRHEDKVHTACFSADGRRIVTASSDKTMRVWDADTGDPLTPSFSHPVSLVSARFSKDQHRIVVTDRLGNTCTWNLPVDTKPVEDLIDLAFLLSGETESASNESRSSQIKSVQAIWQRLRKEYPATFTVSNQDVAAWNELQARDCEKRRNRNAAELHQKPLTAGQPEKE